MKLQDKTILAVDDELETCRLLQLVFARTGAKFYSAVNFEEGMRLFEEHEPDLVLLDLLMPGTNGLTMCRRLRLKSGVPIIMLTAVNQPENIVQCLNAGADDYVVKPFNAQELLARAEAAIRRAALQNQARIKRTFTDGRLYVDLERREVRLDNELIQLTTTEFDLLAHLIQHPNQICTFRQILENVWGAESGYRNDYVHVYVWRLRQKLEQDPSSPRYLHTEHSVGYRFIAPTNGNGH